MRRSATSTAVLCLALTAHVGPSRATPLPSLRVLFVGNGITRFHHLPREVRRLVESDGTSRSAHMARETLPGATLRRPWRSRRIRTLVK